MTTHRKSKAIVHCVWLMLWIFLLLPHAQSASQLDFVKASEADHTIFAQLQSGKRVETNQMYITPSSKTVYLTFDDGPSKVTEHILDILKKEGIAATFFVLGCQAEKYPQLVKRIVNEGHALGNHTYNHVYRQIYHSFSTYWQQTEQTGRILENLVGVKPRLLRAPGGTHANFDAFYFYYLERAGYIIHDWNVDSRDSTRKDVSRQEIINQIRKSPLRPEMNVLFHDGAGHYETQRALPEIISYFIKEGYRFEKLTTQVKPIQFPLVKLMWNRNADFQEYQFNQQFISQ